MTGQQALQVASSRLERRVAAFMTTVQGLLVPGERIEAWATQRRLFALHRRRMFVVATTGRLLVFNRNLIAGYDMRDIRWQDLSSVHIGVGLFGAALTIGVLSGADLSSSERSGRTIFVPGLVKGPAQEVYRLSEAQEQAWREKRRVRDLEEMRARAGGVQIGGGAGSSAPALPQGASSLTERLETAKDMLSRGLITDAEYEAIKAKVIAGI